MNRLFDMISSVYLLKVLQIATKLRIPDLLQKGPLSFNELAKSTQSHPESLYRILRFLANNEFFQELPGKIFRQSAFSELLISSSEASLAPFAERETLDEWIWRSIQQLPETVQTGKAAFPLAHDDLTLWEYFQTINPTAGKNFANEIDLISQGSNLAIQQYDFSNEKCIIDLGGSTGSLLFNILKNHTQLTGVLFDLPETTQFANVPDELNDRTQVISGNFLESVPSNVDVYLLRYILHDWDDTSCISILSNCQKASPKAKILIIESVLEENNNHPFSLLLDIWMLMLFQGAKERTRTEYEMLLHESGYQIQQIIETGSPIRIIEAIPKS